jgi:glycerophosphoryl diester phosphodiesterase
MNRTAGWLILLGVVSLAATDATLLAADRALSAHNRVTSRGVLVIAHRGDSNIAPENTLPAFASAVKAGADLVELDYYHSADGVPVVFHDKDLDRTTDACRVWRATEIKIHGKPLADLRRLDAGSWFDARFTGTLIPTLDEALGVIQAGSMTLIERKGGDPATCIELLKQKMLLDRVVVQAFDWDYLAGCHRIAPELVLCALGHRELTPERLDQIARAGATVVGWEDKDVGARTIAAIHARGWKAWVWTVDDPRRVGELVQAGADGIITNCPGEIRKVVQAAEAARLQPR